MKITVIENPNQRPICIRIPNSLALSTHGIKMLAGIGGKHTENFKLPIDAATFRVLRREIKRQKKIHPNWRIVEVEDASGECVIIEM